MATSGITLLTDAELHSQFGQQGRRAVTEKFCADLVVPKYEAFYESLCQR
jgi:hypothetical protein